MEIETSFLSNSRNLPRVWYQTFDLNDLTNMSTIGVTVATLYQDLWDQAGPDKVFLFIIKPAWKKPKEFIYKPVNGFRS